LIDERHKTSTMEEKRWRQRFEEFKNKQMYPRRAVLNQNSNIEKYKTATNSIKRIGFPGTRKDTSLEKFPSETNEGYRFQEKPSLRKLGFLRIRI